MAYTNEQKERMVAKLMSMPSGTEFKLNKNDSCPLEVRIEKTLAGGKTYLYLVDVETGNNMIVCGFLYGKHDRNECYAKLVDEIEDLIENWDLVLKQHFIDVSRKLGYDVIMNMTKKEYNKRISEVQKLCLSYGLKPEFGKHGLTKTEIDYRYDSIYIKSCGEIVRLWPDFKKENFCIVLFNKLYSDGSCYYWDSKFISEPLKNKIKKYNPNINNILDLKYLYVYGMDLIKETIEFAMKDMKKFDMNIKLKRIEKDF